jgi:4-alpha-glucanotransferase
MSNSRQFGLLLHPTSLPGDPGTGDIGAPAKRFIQILKEMGAGFWQILPLNNPSFGLSPYSADSAFACNPLLIDLDAIKQKEWMKDKDLLTHCLTPDSSDFKPYGSMKMSVLRRVFNHFCASRGDQSRTYRGFVSQHSFWLYDYALFKALKEYFAGLTWLDWPDSYKHREQETLDCFREENIKSIQFQIFLQYIFFSQWLELKQFAANHGVQIIGDLPVFVSLDSADVWANPHLFNLDSNKNPITVAGVPPDYFSTTGQKWGNPHYDWDMNHRSGYEWWKQRIAVLLSMVDVIRIDHFRGFEAYWAIPADASTAENGVWQPGPGLVFFQELKKTFGTLPFIAENLGVITPDVEALRQELNLSGMRVLQFAFDNHSSNTNLFFHHRPEDVVYTGTHDNNTTLGWWESLSHEHRHSVANQLRNLLGHSVTNIVSDMIRMAMGSVCRLAVIPVQDILELPSSARMNTPGTLERNWSWQMSSFQELDNTIEPVRSVASMFDRLSSS